MPLPIPNLDDRTFAQLTTEGRSLIPRYSREWTNHNVSDPGITLLELFAYLVETSIYELNQLPDESIAVFLELMAACAPPGTPLAETIGRALSGLRDQPRAVTGAELTQHAAAIVADEGLDVRRVEHALIHDDACDADVSLVSIVPGAAAPPPYGLEDALFFALEQRALLGTRLEVARAVEIPVTVTTALVRVPGGGVDAQVVTEAVQEFLDPFVGGHERTGWPFGRTVYRSELYRLLEGLPGVDHVETLELAGPDGPVAETEPGVPLPPGGLVAEPATVVADVRDPS